MLLYSRSYSKESNKEEPGDQYDDDDDDQLNSKLENDEPDQEETQDDANTRGYRRDGRLGPTPKFRAYTSEELKQREASQSKY